MTRMSPLLKVVTTFLDTVGRESIVDADQASIDKARAQVYPTFPPFSWITGPVDRTVAIDEGSTTARDGARLPLRWYRPRGAAAGGPVVVYLHGGGWVQGNMPMYDPLCTHIAARVGVEVVSVGYRKAPEHRAPVAAHDAIDAVRWLHEQGRQRIGLCGDSAGSNLAAVVAQQLRDLRGADGEPVIAHQALIYPATDLTFGSPSIEENARAAILDKAKMVAFRGHYLGDAPDAVEKDDPIVSPLFGDPTGVAPALVQTADLDPIRDDGLRYGTALRAAGVATRVTNYVGVPHGFASFPGLTVSGSQQRAELVTEIRAHLLGDA